MISNQGVSSELILKVGNGTDGTRSTTSPAFAVYYDAVKGTPVQGVGR